MVQTRLRYLRRRNLLSVIPAGTVWVVMDMEVAAFLKKNCVFNHGTMFYWPKL